MTVDDLIARLDLLESEITANEEENRIFQEELNNIYDELDKRQSK